jgi:hypothetical protein|tara:strand:- start:6068 stop:6298 length:231 start_codon:yes stop_codon:yes gene_type:complete
MDLMETLRKYIALVGIVTTIGGGFYAWGVFNNRLDELEQSKSTKNIKAMQKEIANLDKRLGVLESQVIQFKNPLAN